MAKIKRFKHPIEAQRYVDSTNFSPTKLAFNFSFITSDRKYNFQGKHFTKVVKLSLLQNLIKLSEHDLVTILSWDKQTGLESLPTAAVGFKVNADFVASGRFESCLAGYWVFRLNQLGRVIGKIYRTTFYILCLDLTFDTYNHGS